MFLPWLQCLYMILSAIQLFVPIMGRSGAANNAEVIIAALTTSMLNFQYSYLVCFSRARIGSFLVFFTCLLLFQVPLILLVRNPRQIFVILGSIFVIGLSLIVFTPLGFPYSGNPASLAPQRYVLLVRHPTENYLLKLN